MPAEADIKLVWNVPGDTIWSEQVRGTGLMTSTPPITYSPRTLAARWSVDGSKVSEARIRAMLRRGELRYFRIGKSGYRITAATVEEYERGGTCGISESPAKA